MIAIREESLARAIAGDRDAAEKLFRLYAPSLRRRVESQIPTSLQSLVEPEDVLQETFTEAFVAIEQCRARCGRSFFAWLCSIAANNLADLQRALFAMRRDARRTSTWSLTEQPLEQLAWDLTGHDETPSFPARQSELAQLLSESLQNLPPESRQVVVLYDLRQWSIEAVAEKLNCSVGSVYMRRQRAHRMLRKILESFSLYP
jgi:RNA polymerase sigma-70 factor (subfamily 1)